MKKHVFKIISFSVALLMALTVVACGQSDDPPASDEVLVCLITEVPAGAPFTDLTWRGFERLQSDLGVEITLIEAMDVAEIPEQIRSMARLNASPIYAMFDTVNEVLLEIAPEFPDVKFFMIDCEIEHNLPNVVNLIVDPYEASFIAGFVAAKTTETGKIGWIGHLDHPTIIRFRDGFTAGAKYADPSVEVFPAFTGDANDPVKGQETARIIIAEGVDVIFQSANQSGLGVIAACAEAGIKAIGVDDWQGDIDPVVFWSALKDIDGAIYETGRDTIEGRFRSGRIEFGLATNSKAFDQRDFDRLPPELQDEVRQLVEDISAGRVDVFAN